MFGPTLASWACRRCRAFPRAATTQPEAWSAVKSVTAGQASNWVFGIEAQGDWADFQGARTPACSRPGVTNQTRMDAIGLFTGQVGYAWNNVLWYVKGGGGPLPTTSTTAIATGIAFDQATDTRWGGTVGTGLEISFAPSWSVAVEYDHLFMGNRTLNFIGIAAPVTSSLRQHQAGRRHRERPRELSLGRSGDCEVLNSSRQLNFAPEKRLASCRPFLLRAFTSRLGHFMVANAFPRTCLPFR